MSLCDGCDVLNLAKLPTLAAAIKKTAHKNYIVNTWQHLVGSVLPADEAR